MASGLAGCRLPRTVHHRAWKGPRRATSASFESPTRERQPTRRPGRRAASPGASWPSRSSTGSSHCCSPSSSSRPGRWPTRETSRGFVSCSASAMCWRTSSLWRSRASSSFACRPMVGRRLGLGGCRPRSGARLGPRLRLCRRALFHLRDDRAQATDGVMASRRSRSKATRACCGCASPKTAI